MTLPKLEVTVYKRATNQGESNENNTAGQSVNEKNKKMMKFVAVFLVFTLTITSVAAQCRKYGMNGLNLKLN